MMIMVFALVIVTVTTFVKKLVMIHQKRHRDYQMINEVNPLIS